MLGRLSGKMLKGCIRAGESLARDLLAELEVETFQKKRIIVENEDRSCMVEGGHCRPRSRNEESTFRKDVRTTLSYRIRYGES